MSTSKTKNITLSMGFVGPLTLLFIALKLLGVIGWSWWWVLSPIWISWAIALAILCIVIILCVIAAVLDK